MEFTIHQQMLAAVFAIAVVMGAVANKTNFCTMGAVSDWINMGDSGRLRAWLLAIAIALLGVAGLTAFDRIDLASGTFPPYRTAQFAWLRYLLGGLMFGIGMTLGSGCGNRILVRIGGGNFKSLVVLAITAWCAYLMVWTDFYAEVFDSWISATTVDLRHAGLNSQALSEFFGGTRHAQAGVGLALGLGLAALVLLPREFRGDFDNLLAGLVIGAAIVLGWYLTAGPMGAAWKEWAEMADIIPSRVESQSFTFISPMGDSIRYLSHPGEFANLNFGILALAGVTVGSFLHALLARRLRFEWFVSLRDFLAHAAGAALMGFGGVLSMGCTFGQGISGISTLAMGSILTFLAIVAGAVLTMKFQYWRLMRQA